VKTNTPVVVDAASVDRRVNRRATTWLAAIH
jgi:hypothetical protein